MLRFRSSISTRLVVWISLLISVLFVLVLLVIEQREVRILMDETRTRAVLFANYMADVNLQPLVRYDRQAMEQNIESRVGPDIPYVVFYDREGAPLAFNESIKDVQDIVCCTRVPDDAERGYRSMTVRRLPWSGDSLRVLEVEMPVFLPGSVRKWASLKVGQSLEPAYAEIKNIRLVLLVVGLGGLGLGLLGAFLLSSGITRPLHKLVEATVSLAGGDFSQRIDIKSRDEIGELARSFNEMTFELQQARLRMEEAGRRLLQAEKLASIGRMAATIAHEIRNPLTSVKLNIQKIAEFPGFSETEQEHLSLALEGIVQIERFIRELLDFTRVAELNLMKFPVEQVIEESLKLLRDRLGRRHITVERVYGSGLPAVELDADKMRQVFLNVIRNAEEALHDGGRIEIAVDRLEEDGRPKVRVRISDDGPGIPQKDWENIFEPFFSTKPSGFGLGLANARKIVEQHSGRIKVVKKEGEGSMFEVVLPVERGK